MVAYKRTAIDAVKATAPSCESTTELALVLLWSLDEPERVGEVLWFLDNQQALLNCGESRFADKTPHAVWLRQRPGSTEAAPPLASQHMSLLQLHVERRGTSLCLRNVGKGKLMFRGTTVDACTLMPGETAIIGGTMVVMCTQRQSDWDKAPPQDARLLRGEFGEACAVGIVGESPCIWALRRRLAFIAGRQQHVLILGESGTGKELVARGLHALSSRCTNPLVSRSAATIPESLFDAELFGNARNYPNPGMHERPGLVGEADGSSLFLDEVGEVPEALQAHLLRLLDKGGEYHRLGEARARRSDVRLIAATNRPKSALKHDLLARLLLRLELPPLSARREDIPLLIIHLLRRAAEVDSELSQRFFKARRERLYPRIAPELVEALVHHRYTHHARELEGLLWAALTSCSEGRWMRLTPEVEQRLNIEWPVQGKDQEVSREELIEAMKTHKGVREKVWRVLRLKNRYVLRRLLDKHGVGSEEIGRELRGV